MWRAVCERWAQDVFLNSTGRYWKEIQCVFAHLHSKPYSTGWTIQADRYEGSMEVTSSRLVSPAFLSGSPQDHTGRENPEHN